MEGDNIGSAKLTHLMISIESGKLKSLINRLNESQIIEVKRTTKARLMRFEVPTEGHLPVAILPGSSQKFSVKIDTNSNYYFTAYSDSGVSEVIHADKSMEKDRKISEPLTKEHGELLLNSIWLSQKYLCGVEQRVNNGLVDVQTNPHILVPFDLLSIIIAIEGVFQNEGINAIEELKTGTANLISFLNSRVKSFKDEMVTLSRYLSDSGKVSTNVPESASEDIDRLFIPAMNWDEHRSLEYFIGESEPNEYNLEHVIKAIENLLEDFLLVDEWISDNSVTIAISKDISKLKLKLNESEISYDAVLEQLDPVEKALANDIGTNPELNSESAKSECERIRELCSQPFTVEKAISNSPKLLKSNINNIIHQNGLTELMSAEIKNYFEGFYNKITNGGQKPLDTETLEATFLNINNIKYGYDKALELYGEARKTIQDHSTTKDTERIRKDAESEISEAIRAIRKQMMTESDEVILKKSSKKSQFDAIDMLDDIKQKLSANASDETVFWIGLGQAGGQILRECLLYCLNNLSDARCRALITALGAQPQDLRDIQHNFKGIYSSNPDDKKAAGLSLEKIFHNKIHLLAVNLGEEVDELAKLDQPGYFLWGSGGKSLRADSTSRTVRTTKNILKLKPKGEGAGGETGVGRAYGFRFRQDLTDVMKDVGKKGNSSPKHIVITHSLAGGSGSGMVLPVLQQARRTFGPDAVIWVVSVGEGASESRSVAKVNTPFIISDILQATYDGIHAIHEPITLNAWRSFGREVSTAAVTMADSAKELVMILSGNAGDVLLTQLSTILQGGHEGKFHDNSENWTEKYGELKDNNNSQESLNMSTLITNQLDVSIIKNDFVKSINAMLSILPYSKDQSADFTSWCKEQKGGFKPASDFWMTWLDCVFDPLSMFLEGKTKQHQTVADEAGGGGKQYFTPNLTGGHLKSVIDKIFYEEDIENERGQPGINSDISPAMVPLKDAILNYIAKFDTKAKKQENLFLIKKKLDDYAYALDKTNKAKTKMTVHIQSLSGTAGDRLVKSIIVSNAHLEKGIISTNNLESSGKAYTVYNSVIFDLMLNIIGTRLPTEEGSFIMDEKIDHMDMVKSTNPPLVVGLLNHRDSASLTEPPERKVGKINPDDVSTLFTSMFTQPYANPGGVTELSNPMFLAKMELSDKSDKLFLSLFGSRYKYMLQVNPYNTINSNGLDENGLNSYCDQLTKLWDSRSEKVFDVGPDNREILMKANGITGLHISNLVKWISLIEKESLSRFIGTNRSQSTLCQLMSGTDKVWGAVRNDGNTVFDIGVLRIDSSISRFIGKDSERNSDHLNNSLPKMGIHNTEILRSVGSAYLNSFLPIELLYSITEINLDTSKFDYKSFGFSDKSFNKKIEEEIDYTSEEFSSMLIGMLKENHTLKIDGTIDDPDSEIEELLECLGTEVNCVLDYFDLQLISDGSQYRLRLHPRLNRYFSAVRDIPTKPGDKLLPARNASASLSRYLHADSLDKPLDADYEPENRTGIASPTFTLGGHIMNQMRYIGLLPDEKRLSLIPLMRILLLGTEDGIVLKNRLGPQFASMGLDLELLSPYIDRILGVRYGKTEVFNEPAIYTGLVSVFIKRLHESKSLLVELSNNPPNGWNNFDIDAIGFLLEQVLQDEEIMSENIDEVDKLYGNNVESIPDVRTWLQDVYSIIGKGTKQASEGTGNSSESVGEGSDDEEISTVSNENPSIVGLKQLFYDVAYNLNEALGQAIYLNQDNSKSSRSVHFEMTGFSDRLIGKPKGLLVLVHDRNPKLPMDAVQSSIRESINYNFGLKLGSPKAFNTAADYGPTSYLTVVLQNAPAADISDQFQKLVHDKSEGLSGNNPFWAFENSKLHPYILLYNLLWLSAKINKWIDPGNHEYIRRFQLPTNIIELHYSNPVKLDNDKIRLEKEKQSFPGDINMPEEDTRDFNTALSGSLGGVRNIMELIGITALRYEKAAGIIDKKVWSQQEEDYQLSEDDYKEMKESFGSDAELLGKEHLLANKKETGKKTKVNRFFKKKKKRDGPTNGDKPTDTLESRAIAWFKAYGAWKNYPKTHSSEDRIDDVGKFEADLESSDE